jgi:hypothetical protein
MSLNFTNREINVSFAYNREICRRDMFFNISSAEAKIKVTTDLKDDRQVATLATRCLKTRDTCICLH